jgi:hypothetical protein
MSVRFHQFIENKWEHVKKRYSVLLPREEVDQLPYLFR